MFTHDTMTADEWNRLYPPGTPVRYWPIAGERDHRDAETRSEAWTLRHGSPVVQITGVSGGVVLSHVMPLPYAPRRVTPEVFTRIMREFADGDIRTPEEAGKLLGIEVLDE